MTKIISTEPPEENPQERALEILMLFAKGATIPTVVGPFVVEIIQQLLKKPMQKRTVDWMQEVTDAINQIASQQENFTPSKLAENEDFVSILLRASDLAVKTHQSEKRTFFKNAIISSGMPKPPSLDKQMFFLRTIDELSLNQILVLSFYDDPRGWLTKRNINRPEYHSAPRSAILVHAYPGLANDAYLNELIFSELQRRNLLGDMTLGAFYDTIYDSVTTSLGKEFLLYIKAGNT